MHPSDSTSTKLRSDDLPEQIPRRHPLAGRRLRAEPALDAVRADVVHGLVERQAGGDERRAADEVRGGRVRGGGHARARGPSPERRWSIYL
jgi:hypothetical protein